MADDAARGTKQVAGVAADEATSVAQEAKDQARSLWDQTSSQLSSQAADQKDTLVSWLRNLADGDYFGEIGLLRATNRTATVRALTPTILLCLSRAQFAELLKIAPGLATEFEELVRSRVPALS